jgi:hypothetical protein
MGLGPDITLVTKLGMNRSSPSNHWFFLTYIDTFMQTTVLSSDPMETTSNKRSILISTLIGTTFYRFWHLPSRKKQLVQFASHIQWPHEWPSAATFFAYPALSVICTPLTTQHPCRRRRRVGRSVRFAGIRYIFRRLGR